MVIFEDLHKLLLYQRLNLGFDCTVCERKFYNKLDYLVHTRSCKKVSEKLVCSKCGKTFSNQQILHLHMQFHNNLKVSTECQQKPECVQIIDSDDEDDRKKTSQNDKEAERNPTESRLECKTKLNIREPQISQNGNETQTNKSLPSPTNIAEPPKKRSIYKPRATPKVKKKIGLTKVKFEDCLRCDDCSCIYIDERDYYKHMRNFHQIDLNTNMPLPQQRTKRKCRSCCKQCRGGHCTSVKRQRATQLASNLSFKINMRDNIKNRWTKMVSQQLNEYPVLPLNSESSEQVEVKPDLNSINIKVDPDEAPDLSHLLSQVEVKIKTEPADDYI